MVSNLFFDLSEMLDLPAPKWLLEGILPAAGLGVMYGQPGVGKSFVALDMALTLALRQVPVLYIAAEGGGGYGSRIRAWFKFHRKPATCPIVFLPFANLDLNDESQVRGLIRDLEFEYGSFPDFVVIDTLARCMTGNESSAGDMGVAIRNVARLGQKMQAFVLLVHHSTKASSVNIRGSGALHGACDMAIQIDLKNDIITVSCEKSKDAREFSRYSLRLHEVHGSCVVLPEAPHRAPRYMQMHAQSMKRENERKYKKVR